MPELGDLPIQPEFQKKMRAIAEMLDNTFNGRVRGPDRKVGFILLVFPFGQEEGRCNYISNGASREDVVKLLEEQVRAFREIL